jgi:hypothetical protein
MSPKSFKGPEFQVQARFHNIDVRSYANAGGRDTAHCGSANQSARCIIAEMIVVVLDTG